MSVASFAMSRTSQRSRTPSVVTSNRFTLSGKKNLKKSTQAKIPRSAASAFFSTDQLKSMSARPISVKCSDDSLIIETDSKSGEYDIQINNEYLFEAIQALLSSQTDIYDREKIEESRKEVDSLLEKLRTVKDSYESSPNVNANVNVTTKEAAASPEVISAAIDEWQARYFQSEEFAQLIGDLVELHLEEAVANGGDKNLDNEDAASQAPFENDDGTIDLPDAMMEELVGGVGMDDAADIERSLKSKTNLTTSIAGARDRKARFEFLNVLPPSTKGIGHGDLLIYNDEHKQFVAVSLDDVLELINQQLRGLEEIVSLQDQKISSLTNRLARLSNEIENDEDED